MEIRCLFIPESHQSLLDLSQWWIGSTCAIHFPAGPETLANSLSCFSCRNARERELRLYDIENPLDPLMLRSDYKTPASGYVEEISIQTPVAVSFYLAPLS